MKRAFAKFSICTLIAFGLSSFFTARDKDFTEKEKAKAKTATTASYMNEAEKEVIYYINLCRLNPSKFLEYYIEKSEYLKEHEEEIKTSPQYLSTLRATLKKMKHLDPLQPDRKMYDLATCFAKEQGPSGKIGHDRKKCKSDYGAECITYGNHGALNIVIDLLLDLDVPSYGHRQIIIGKYKGLGVSIGEHELYETMAVLDFN